MLAQLFEERYSCRAYLAQPVPRPTIEAILQIAQRTASWCNSQGWQLHVSSAVATQRLRDSLLSHVQAQDAKAAPDLDWPEYEGVHLQRRRECGRQLYAATGVARGDTAAADRQRLENFRFFGAPHVALVTSDAALGTYGAVDCGAYVSSFMLAARAHGVACIAQAALAAHADFWHSQLAMPDSRRLVCGISFGYEDASHAANAFRTTRASVQEAVQWVET
ncbi:MAG: nitroreductase [Stenotrophomonas sp.]